MTIVPDAAIQSVAERVKAAESAHRLAHPGPEPGNYDPADGANAYVLIPPIPNITGGLHIGHAVSFVIQDTLARRARGRGRNVLFPVGTDHAGLTGQVVAERRLAERGESRHDLGREGFAAYMAEWAREHTDLVIRQSASLGVAADWDHRVSTLDDAHSRETARAFRKLVETDLVYRARAITSWCVQCESCVSVAEIRRDERHLDVFRFAAYTTSGLRLEIATLSPEVIVGAVAVGVPADHPQAAELSGAKIELPLTGRLVPVIDVARNEEPLERTARLIVPAYNAADLDLAAEEGLAVPEIFDTRGRIISSDPRWNGKSGPACRELMLTELAELSLLLTGGTILRGLALHGLCGSSVIPRLCSQWYLRAEALYGETLAGLADPELRFNLEKWRARCEDWVHATIGEASKAPRWWEGACLALVQGHDSNRDWILSRQNWWGQQIPAWECARCGSGGALAEDEPLPAACRSCGQADPTRSTDVFDVWFYGAVFSVGTSPTTGTSFGELIVIGHDILEFWVPAQTMLCKHLYGRLPFREVVVHGLICDESGRKMSKSLGNTVDLDDVLARYGVESVRAAVYLMLDDAAESETLAFGEGLLARAVAAADTVLGFVRAAARAEVGAGSGPESGAGDEAAGAWIARVQAALDEDDPGAAYRELRAGLDVWASASSVGINALSSAWARRALETVAYFHPLLVGSARTGA